MTTALSFLPPILVVVLFVGAAFFPNRPPKVGHYRIHDVDPTPRRFRDCG